MANVDVSEVFIDLFDRIPDLVRGAVADLDPEALAMAPAPGANTVGWLVWHLTRVQDSHVAELVGEDQVWATGPWPARFGLEPDPSNTGYGHSPAEVASVRPDSGDALIEYYAAVAARTRAYLQGLTADDLDRIVDQDWDPPVTLGVRLVSVADDDLEHAGQAAYVRGLVRDRS